MCPEAMCPKASRGLTGTTLLGGELQQLAILTGARKLCARRLCALEL